MLYAGSSNCTRRGLGLGGPTNHEAGFVYRLSPRLRKQVARLLDFAAPPTEVLADTPPATVQPQPTEEVAIPTFDAAPEGIAIAKDNKAMFDAVNAAITAMKGDGTLAAIEAKWGIK